MNILLYVDDYYSNKGVNYDIYYSKYILKKYTNINCYIIHYGEKEDIKNRVFTLSGLSMLEQLDKIKRIIVNNDIKLLHIRGLMSKNHLKIYTFSYLIDISLIISPFSQTNTFNLNNKLFFEDPDVNSLLRNKKKNKNSLKQYISPLLKKIYLKSIGNIVLKKSKALIFFSTFEKNEHLKIVSINKKYYIVEEPILKYLELEELRENNQEQSIFYKLGYEDNINIVYWGRLDFNLKGIDRLLVAFGETKNKKVILHLMGPDYNSGEKQIRNYIGQYKLDNVIIHDQDIWKGTKKPLIDADLSILASRWDGFPRALRESIALHTPIIVSVETNFADMIEKFNCGYVFRANDELIEILNNLDKEQIQQKKVKISEAVEYLQEENIAKKLIRIYKECV